MQIREMNPLASCLCDSKKAFGKCCGLFLSGRAKPKTVKQLMRSRYSAYALGGYGEYLLASWHPDTAPTLNIEALSKRETNWQGLQVIAHSQTGNIGTVEFKASYLNDDNVSCTHHELSHFERLAGTWLYVDAQE